MAESEKGRVNFLCPERYYDITLCLDEFEFTRLFRAAMEYCFFGKVKQELGARDGAMFEFIKRDIDFNNEKYAEKCRKSKEAIQKRWEQEKQKAPEDTAEVESIQGHTDEYERIPPNTNDTKYKYKSKDKDKSKDKNKPLLSPLDLEPLSDRSPELIQAVKDWFEYKKQRKDAYTEIGQKKLITQILNNCKQYGDLVIADLINECISRGYKGIIFDMLKEQHNQPVARPQQPKQEQAPAQPPSFNLDEFDNWSLGREVKS